MLPFRNVFANTALHVCKHDMASHNNTFGGEMYYIVQTLKIYVNLVIIESRSFNTKHNAIEQNRKMLFKYSVRYALYW